MMSQFQKTGFDLNRLPASQHVNPDFKCGICWGVVNDPVHCSNRGADLFCRHCLEEWYKTTPLCPTCRAPARRVLGRVVTDEVSLIIKKQIMALDIKCCFEERGCTKVTSIERIASHENNCDFGYSDFVATKFQAIQSIIVSRDETISKLTSELNFAKRDHARKISDMTASLAMKDETINDLRQEMAKIKSDKLRKRPNDDEVDSAPAKRSKSDLTAEVDKLKRNRLTNWVNCHHARNLTVEMQYALLKTQTTFMELDWFDEPAINSFSAIAGGVKPGDNVLCLGNSSVKFLTAIAIFVGNRGSVYVYLDCCSTADRIVFESRIKKVDPKLVILKEEANIIVLKGREDNLEELEKECHLVINSGEFDKLGEHLESIIKQRRDQGDKFTLNEAISVLKELQNSENSPSTE